MARTSIVITYTGGGQFPLDLMITYPRQFIRHVFNSGGSLDVTDIVSSDELNRNAEFARLLAAGTFTCTVTAGADDIDGAGFGSGPALETVTGGASVVTSGGTALPGVSSKVSAADHVHALTALSIVAGDIAANAVTTAKILDSNVTTAKLAAATQQALCAVLSFGQGAANAGATTLLAPGSGAGSTSVELQIPVPHAGVIRNLRAKFQTAPSAGHTDVITVRKGGSDQTLTCSVVDAATTGSDSTHSFSVVAGDLISVKNVQPAGSLGANLQVAMDYAIA